MNTNTQEVVTQVATTLASLVTLLESLATAQPDTLAKATLEVARAGKDATGFLAKLPFRISTKSHGPFAKMLQALCENADTERAMEVAGTKTAKDWIAKFGGIDVARKWAKENFANALQTAITTPHEVVKTLAKPIAEATQLAGEYFAKRVADGKPFRVSQKLVGYGHDATSGAMFAIVQSLVKDVRDKHIRAVGKTASGLPTQVVKGTANWEPLVKNSQIVKVADGPVVWSRKKTVAEPRETVHEVHDEVGSFFV